MLLFSNTAYSTPISFAIVGRMMDTRCVECLCSRPAMTGVDRFKPVQRTALV